MAAVAGIIAIATGFTGLVVFLWVARRQSNPVEPLSVGSRQGHAAPQTDLEPIRTEDQDGAISAAATVFGAGDGGSEPARSLSNVNADADDREHDACSGSDGAVALVNHHAEPAAYDELPPEADRSGSSRSTSAPTEERGTADEGDDGECSCQAARGGEDFVVIARVTYAPPTVDTGPLGEVNGVEGFGEATGEVGGAKSSEPLETISTTATGFLPSTDGERPSDESETPLPQYDLQNTVEERVDSATLPKVASEGHGSPPTLANEPNPSHHEPPLADAGATADAQSATPFPFGAFGVEPAGPDNVAPQDAQTADVVGSAIPQLPPDQDRQEGGKLTLASNGAVRRRPRKYKASVRTALATRRSNRPQSDETAVGRRKALSMSVRVVFGRRDHCCVSLLPPRTDDLGEEVDVLGPNGRESWNACQDEWYSDIRAANLGLLLENGGGWVSSRDEDLAWVLASREIYVLARSAAGTISGFLSTTRLMLNEEHVVLCTRCWEEVVRKTLLEVGCAEPATSRSTNGVPDGWVLFRGVRPTKAIEHEDAAGLLNVLRPVRNDVEILLRGGIRLSRSTWLNDHAPQIEVRGKADADIQVLIDETPATAGYDGQYTAAGWDSPGIHTVFCGGVTQSYELIDGLQDWDAFSAFSFARACGKGPDSVGICGPVVVPIATGQKVSLVPSGNTILLGATPGQFAELPQPFDLRAPERLAITGFQAVWAVPANPLRCRTSAGSIQFLPSSYRVEVEVKRRGSGKGRKNRKNKSIRQRPTELKFADAERFEDIYPDDLDRKDCVLLRERAVWRLECGRAILVGYRVFGRQGGPEPRVPGVTPRQALLRWCAAILDSSRRRLFFSPDEPDAKKLWRQHTRTARCLWKQLK